MHRTLLSLSRPILKTPQRLPGALGFGDQRGHLGGLDGVSAVDTAFGAAEGDVLFDDGGAERDCGDPGADAVGVVGEADLGAE